MLMAPDHATPASSGQVWQGLGAVPEPFDRATGAIQQPDQQIAEISGAVLDVATRPQAAAMPRQDGGEIPVVMPVSIAHARAVEHQRVVEQRAIAILDALQARMK
jgi:hypothetical protein